MDYQCDGGSGRVKGKGVITNPNKSITMKGVNEYDMSQHDADAYDLSVIFDPQDQPRTYPWSYIGLALPDAQREATWLTQAFGYPWCTFVPHPRARGVSMQIPNYMSKEFLAHLQYLFVHTQPLDLEEVEASMQEGNGPFARFNGLLVLEPGTGWPNAPGEPDTEEGGDWDSFIEGITDPSQVEDGEGGEKKGEEFPW